MWAVLALICRLRIRCDQHVTMNGDERTKGNTTVCSLTLIYETLLIIFSDSTLQLSSRFFRESPSVLLLSRGLMNYTMLVVSSKLKYANSYLKRVEGTSEAAAPNA